MRHKATHVGIGVEEFTGDTSVVGHRPSCDNKGKIEDAGDFVTLLNVRVIVDTLVERFDVRAGVTFDGDECQDGHRHQSHIRVQLGCDPLDEAGLFVLLDSPLDGGSGEANSLAEFVKGVRGVVLENLQELNIYGVKM